MKEVGGPPMPPSGGCLFGGRDTRPPSFYIKLLRNAVFVDSFSLDSWRRSRKDRGGLGREALEERGVTVNLRVLHVGNVCEQPSPFPPPPVKGRPPMCDVLKASSGSQPRLCLSFYLPSFR